MRRFYLFRTDDVSGVSGTGIVAEGTQFTSGRVVIEWYGEHPSTVVWQSLDDATAIHGHGGSTTVRWADGEAPHPAHCGCHTAPFVHPPRTISSAIAAMDAKHHPEDYQQPKVNIDYGGRRPVDMVERAYGPHVAEVVERVAAEQPTRIYRVDGDGEILRTPDEWQQIRGVRIVDPDGWREPGSPAWTQPISEAEFERRLARCTISRPERKA